MKSTHTKTGTIARRKLRGLPTQARDKHPAGVSPALPTEEQNRAGRAAVDRASPSSAVEPKAGTTTSTKHIEGGPGSVRPTSPEAPTSTSTSAATATLHQGSSHTHNSAGCLPSHEPTPTNSAASVPSRLSQLLSRRQPSSGHRPTQGQDALSPIPIQMGLSPSNTIPTPVHESDARGANVDPAEQKSQQRLLPSTLRGIAGLTVENLRSTWSSSRGNSPLVQSAKLPGPPSETTAPFALRPLPPRPNPPSNEQAPLPRDGQCANPPSSEPPEPPPPLFSAGGQGCGELPCCPAARQGFEPPELRS
jgi:hypothetical protein